MKNENSRKCAYSGKITVPKGKCGAYCELLDLLSNTCKKDGSNKYFHLYCLNGGNGCPTKYNR